MGEGREGVRMQGAGSGWLLQRQQSCAREQCLIANTHSKNVLHALHLVRQGGLAGRVHIVQQVLDFGVLQGRTGGRSAQGGREAWARGDSCWKWGSGTGQAAARTVMDSSKKLASPPRPLDMAPIDADTAPPAAPPTAMATCPENCSPERATPPRLATKSSGLDMVHKFRVRHQATFWHELPQAQP